MNTILKWGSGEKILQILKSNKIYFIGYSQSHILCCVIIAIAMDAILEHVFDRLQ